MNRPNPNEEVADLSGLVGKMLTVFQHVCIPQLKERWANIALHVSHIMAKRSQILKILCDIHFFSVGHQLFLAPVC